MGISGPAKRALVAQHWLAQDGLCWYCGRKCWLNWEAYQLGEQPADLATLEHLFSRGTTDGKRATPKGLTRKDSTVMACAECNKDKGHWTLLMTFGDARIRREEESA